MEINDGFSDCDSDYMKNVSQGFASNAFEPSSSSSSPIRHYSNLTSILSSDCGLSG